MNKVKYFTICLAVIVFIGFVCGTSSIFAKWSYSQGLSSDSGYNTEVTFGSWDAYNYNEVIITKVSAVSNTTISEDSKHSFPTNINSTLTASSGQKVCYKINAHNRSTTNSYVYTGVEFNSNEYTSLQKMSITVSTDAQGTNVLANNPSAKAHRGTLIAPGEDFSFYVTYTFTGSVNSGEVVVNYLFKPIIYSVTYLYNNQTYVVEHVTDNSTSYAVISDNPTQSGMTFAGWVNAIASVVTSIPVGNTNDYTLSASWDNLYLIIFADAQGHVLYEEQFSSSATALSPQGQATVNQILAELNAEAEKDQMSVSWSEYTIKGATGDISVKAIYAYNGILNLVPAYEGANDGIADYYIVEAVDSLPETVVVPGYVGGLQVKMVKRITNVDGEQDWNNFEKNVKTIIIEEGVESLGDKNDKEHNGNALAWTPNLSVVYLPSTLTYLGKNTFSRNIALGGFGSGDDKKVLTIEYNGTMAQWKALINNSDGSWDGGLKDGSVVKCSDGYFELEVVLFSSSWKERSY